MHSGIIASKFFSLTLVFGLWSFVLLIDVAKASEKIIPTDLKADDAFFDKTKYEEVDDENESFMLPNESLPSIRSQDGGNNCIDFCKAAMLQFRYCKEQKEEKKIDDCKSLNSGGKDLISPIFIRSISSPNPNPKNGQLPQRLLVPLNQSVSTKWDFDYFNLLKPKYFLSESCFPYDQFVSSDKINSDPIKLQAFYATLESKFKAAQEHLAKSNVELPKTTEAGYIQDCQPCNEVRDQIAAVFPVKPDHLTLAAALNQKSFGEFLQLVKFGLKDPSTDEAKKHQCKEIELKRPAILKPYPGLNHALVSKRQVLEAAKKQLKARKEPIRMSNICMDRWASDNSCGGHCMLITGYKTLRSKTNPEDTKVLIRMLNSWGEGWQKDHNDGWIDSDKLMANMNDENVDASSSSSSSETTKKTRTTTKKEPDEKGVPDAILSWLL